MAELKAAPIHDDIGERSEKRRRLERKRDEWSGWHLEWLTVRAAYASPARDIPDEEAERLDDRELWLARLITTIPAVQRWMVFAKFEVLEHYLGGSELGTAWTDARELVMLAGIKADLHRFNLALAGAARP